MTDDELPHRAHLARLWALRRTALGRAGIAARVGALILVSQVAAELARAGMARAPLWGRVLLGAAVLGWVGFEVWRLRQLGSPDAQIRRTVGMVSREEGDAVARAFRLVERLRVRPEEGSVALGQAHFARLLDRVDERALRRAWAVERIRLRAIVGGLWVALSFWGVVRPYALLEGLALLGATGRVAPLLVPYVAESWVTVTAPSYLGGSDAARLLTLDSVQLPEGSRLQVHLRLRLTGRDLVLTDGERSVPFTTDGSGDWVAEMLAEETTVLRVAARFGDHLILDPFERVIAAEPDRAPTIELKDAPRTLSLAEVSRLDLDYTVTDDHGVTQVELVLQTGRQVERKELVRPPRGLRLHHGAHRIGRETPLIAKAFLPVHLWIEAKDGNTASGPSTGRSAEITLVPAPLGHSIADRYAKLRAFRGALVQFYGAERREGFGGLELRGAARKERLDALQDKLVKLFAELDELSEKSSATKSFLQGQLDALVRDEGPRQTAEGAVLATDALLMELSLHDAKRLGEQLAAAVDEIASGARQSALSEKGPQEGSIADSILLVESGAKELSRVGVHGADLGAVALADLARVQATFAARDWDGVERAAVHLASRLRRGRPSFSSKGEGRSGGSGSSGGESGQSSGSGSPSDAPSQFQELGNEARKLAREQALELNALERAIEEAQRAAARDATMSGRVDEVTKALRESLEGLPERGQGLETASTEAALGRNQGDAMAGALDAFDFAGARQRGRLAEQALERARALQGRFGSLVSEEAIRRGLDGVRKALSQLSQLESESRARAESELGAELRERGRRQNALADKAEKLAQRARSGESRLPGQSLEGLGKAAELMRRAAQALESGDAQAARELGQGAESELLKALPGEEGDSGAAPTQEAGPEGEGGAEGPPGGDAPIPAPEENLGRSFRDRVQSGLSGASEALSPAVRRYLESLQ